jgi:hypothetical protein
MRDVAAVNFVLRHPKIFSGTRHDYSPEAHKFSSEYLLRGDPYYVLIDDKNSVVCAGMSENGILVTAHQAILPAARGGYAVKVVKSMCQWMFDNTPCKKLIGWVPESNRAAKMFAIMAGFRVEYKLEKSYQHEGKLSGLYLVSKEA